MKKIELNKKIKDLELDLRLKLLEISSLDKWTKAQNKDYNFYLKLSNLLEQAQNILNDKHCKDSEKTCLEKGLLSLLREKNGLSEPDHNKVQKMKGNMGNERIKELKKFYKKGFFDATEYFHFEEDGWEEIADENLKEILKNKEKDWKELSK